MWKLLRDNKQYYVTITFCPHYVACTILESSESQNPFFVTVHERIELSRFELEKLVIYNPTRIQTYLKTWVQKYGLQNAYFTFALQGPLLFERYVELTTHTPGRADFAYPELKGLSWDYRYMYTTEYGSSIFYVAGLAQSLIMQYRLLAIRLKLNLVTIAPASMAFLQVYQYQYGAAFRRSQFAVDMQQHHNITDYLCTPEMLFRLVRVPDTMSIDRERDIWPLLVACGMRIADKDVR